MTLHLTIAAIILVVVGIARLFAGDVPVGMLLIVFGLLVGPGGISILS